MAGGVTLEEYVERVVATSARARALSTDLDVARAEVVAAGIWPNPSVEVSRQANAAGVRATETQDQALLSIPLVLSGRLGLERQSAERGVVAAEARLAHARGQLHHEATTAFLDLVAARERVKLHTASIAALSEVVQAIRAREKAGEAAGYDRVRVELELGRLESALAAARSHERDALARARALWPADGGELIVGDRDLQRSLLGASSLPGDTQRSRSAPMTPAATFEEDVEQRADVRALAAEQQAAALAADAAARSWLPEPTLSGGAYILDVIEEKRGVGYAVTVEVPLPVFRHGQGDVARARARAARAEAERALLVHTAKEQLAAGLARMQSRTEQARRHEEQVLTPARELQRTATHAYRAGGMELLVLVDAERSFIEAELAAIELRLLARRAENDLQLLSGSYDSTGATDADAQQSGNRP